MSMLTRREEMDVLNENERKMSDMQGSSSFPKNGLVELDVAADEASIKLVSSNKRCLTYPLRFYLRLFLTPSTPTNHTDTDKASQTHSPSHTAPNTTCSPSDSMAARCV